MLSCSVSTTPIHPKSPRLSSSLTLTFITLFLLMCHPPKDRQIS